MHYALQSPLTVSPYIVDNPVNKRLTVIEYIAQQEEDLIQKMASALHDVPDIRIVDACTQALADAGYSTNQIENLGYHAIIAETGRRSCSQVRP